MVLFNISGNTFLVSFARQGMNLLVWAEWLPAYWIMRQLELKYEGEYGS